MNILCLDFETYYDIEYSLNKMATVEYIMDARFQPIMMCYSINGSPIQTAVGYPQIRDVLDNIDWNNTIVVGQNTKFDGSILSLRFGKFAKAYVDVMAMVRVTGFHVIAGGASLEKIADQLRVMGYPIPRKGHAVKSAQGMHLYDIYGTPYLAKEKASTPHEKTLGVEMLEQYKQYCRDDVLLTQCAFDYFKKLIPPQEMAYGDMILKCYIKPQFYLDLGIIQEEIQRIEERDREKIAEVARTYFHGDTQLMRETMRSVPKFTKFLQQIGGVFEHECGEDVISPRFFIPVKYSEKKGIVQPCYAKTHPPVLDLLEGDDEELSTIFSMKLALTSSIEMTRAKRFERIAKLGVGFGMPYEVSGAHTHRLGGSDKLNVQNLSSGRKAGQSNALKRSITAPDGHVCVAYDSSQVECRVLPYIASDLEYLQVFIDGKDPYSVMASKIYGGDPDDIKRKAKDEIPPYSTIQRPAGKAAVLGCGYGTGWSKFKDFAKQMGVVLTDEESQQIVLTFRQTHDAIVSFWKYCDTVFHRMIAGDSGYFGGLDGKLFYYDGARRLHGRTVPSIRLPDGNWLHYTDLCYRDKEMPDGSVKRNFAYRGMKEGRVQWIFTYGARLVENLTQALAYSVLKYQASLINKRYQIAGNTHDEWFIVAKEDEAEDAKKYMEWCMRQVPTWAKGLPLDCEGKYAKHYGDC